MSWEAWAVFAALGAVAVFWYAAFWTFPGLTQFTDQTEYSARVATGARSVAVFVTMLAAGAVVAAVAADTSWKCIEGHRPVFDGIQREYHYVFDPCKSSTLHAPVYPAMACLMLAVGGFLAVAVGLDPAADPAHVERWMRHNQWPYHAFHSWPDVGRRHAFVSHLVLGTQLAGAVLATACAIFMANWVDKQPISWSVLAGQLLPGGTSTLSKLGHAAAVLGFAYAFRWAWKVARMILEATRR